MTIAVGNSREFLAIYNEIDEFMRRRLNIDDKVPHKRLIDELIKKDKVFYRYKDDLYDFARLRNAIVHNPYEAHAEPIAEPHSYVVSKYRKIKNELLNPVKVIDISVRCSAICSSSLESNALEIMKRMKENAFIHVPVLKNGIVIGVFSLYSVFAYLTENEGKQINSQTKVGDLINYLSLEQHQGEYFRFAAKDCLVIDIEELFNKRLENNKRLVMLFITENGKPEEKLLGIVSAWDVASRR